MYTNEKITPLKFKDELRNELVEITSVINMIREKDRSINEKYSFLQVIIDSLPNPLYTKDKELKVQFCNKAFELMMRKSKEDIINKSLPEIFPDNKYIYDVHLKDVELIHKGGSETYEADLFPEGKLRRVIFYKCTFRNDDNDIIGLVSSCVDITEITDQKRKLQLSEEKFSRAFNESPLPMMITDYDTGAILNMNRQLVEFTGLKLDDVKGRCIFDGTCECTHEKGFFVDKNLKREDFLQELKLNNGYIKNKKLQVYDKNAEVRTVILTAMKYPVNGHSCILSMVEDITDTEHARQELIRSEQHYRNIFEQSVEGIFQTTIDGRYIKVNQSFAKIFGYSTPGELINSINDIGKQIYVNAHDREKIVALLMTQGYVQQFGTQLYTKQGKLIWVSINARVVKDVEFGTYFEGTMEDVTEMKEKFDQLALSEMRFKEFFENMSSGVAIYEAVNDGENFVFVGFNSLAEKIDKISRDDVIGKLVTNVFPGIKEYGLFEIFQIVYKTGKSQCFPIKLYKDHRLTGWRDNKIFRLPSGEIVAVYDDVTDQKQAQFEFDDLYNNAPCAYHSLDENGIFVRVNDTELKWLGYTREEMVGKMSFKDILTNKGIESFNNNFPTLKQDGFTFYRDIDLIKKDGTLLPVVLNATSIYDESGKFLRTRTIMTDISYHKDLEKKLKESDDQWQRTFDSFPDAVAIVDMNCNIIKANKILSEKIGKPIDYIIGSKCYEVIHHMTSPPTNCPHIQTMNDGLFHSEYMFEEMFGGQFLSTTSPLFGENNKVIGSVHIIHLHTIGEEK